MKNTKLHLIALIFTFFSTKAQITNPVKWRSKIEKKSGTEYVLTFDGTIKKGYHLYSQFTPKGGPAPLKILFPDRNGNFHPAGKATESQTVTEFNEAFGVNETFFIEKVRIQQAIQVSNPRMLPMRIELTYQVCKEVCIPQKIRFEFDTQSLTVKEVKEKNP